MDLGRGNHSSLGLVLRNQEYISIPNTQPFITPYYSNSLVIYPNVIPIEVLELKDTYAKVKYL